MTTDTLKTWISYWDRASLGPNLGAVETPADLTVCRRYNRCMTAGVMAGVSDAMMWSALSAYRISA